MNSTRALTSSVDQGSDCSTLASSDTMPSVDLVEGLAWPVYGGVSKVGDPLGRLQAAFFSIPPLNHQCDIGFGPVWGTCVERYRARDLISHRDQPPLGGTLWTQCAS